jgi:hypothetical protein
MKAWLNDLVDEYPTKRTETAIVRLARIYNEYSASIMQAAVDDYMLSEQFFPKVATLKPYVDLAVENARGRDRIQHTDGEILAWEIERGTMTGDIEAPDDDWRAAFVDVTMPAEVTL